MAFAGLKTHSKKIQDSVKITPCLILVDNSDTIRPYISQVNESLREMVKQIKEDQVCSSSVDLAIYSFNQGIREVLPFSKMPYLRNARIESLRVHSSIFGTCLGEAIEEAVKLLADHREAYENDWVQTNMPNLLILSDFHPTFEPIQTTKRGIAAIRKKVETEHWKCIPVGVGACVNEEIMQKIAGQGELIRFSGADQVQNIIAAFQFVSGQVISNCFEAAAGKMQGEIARDVEKRRLGFEFIKKNGR